ncbi:MULTISPECIES: hypothetical protein [unclassified Mesorhizobium]|uniref:hypothetical protein n=1 Tax=unclassified Mesorhizobium TaxID=325217 RepID=UPI003336AEE2
MASVEIGTADHSDFDGWLPLWNGCQWFYAVDIRGGATAMTCARFLDSSAPVRAAIAMVDGHAFSLVHWSIIDPPGRLTIIAISRTCSSPTMPVGAGSVAHSSSM